MKISAIDTRGWASTKLAVRALLLALVMVVLGLASVALGDQSPTTVTASPIYQAWGDASHTTYLYSMHFDAYDPFLKRNTSFPLSYLTPAVVNSNSYYIYPSWVSAED